MKKPAHYYIIVVVIRNLNLDYCVTRAIAGILTAKWSRQTYFKKMGSLRAVSISKIYSIRFTIKTGSIS